MKFKDNQEIIEFLGKAQSKIGELGTYIASRKHDKSSSDLCKELVYVVEAFSSKYNTWTEAEAINIVNYYNLKAELNNVPYLKVIGYEVKVNKVIGNGTTTTSVNDLVDYISRTNQLISQTKHNTLLELQGGKVGEYYHLDKAMFDKLKELTYPFTSPTVKLLISPSSLIRERGIVYNSTTLTGSYILNSGKTALKSKYYANNSLLTEYTGASVGNNYVDSNSVSSDITYKYEVDFEEGGSKSTSLTIQYVLPYYSFYGSVTGKPSSAISATGLTGSSTKVLGAKPKQVDVTYTMATGNASTSSPTSPRLYIPASYGKFTKITVDNNDVFNYMNDWVVYDVVVTLADGSTENYYAYKFTQAAEGTFNFNFKWQ